MPISDSLGMPPHQNGPFMATFTRLPTVNSLPMVPSIAWVLWSVFGSVIG